MTDPVPFEIFKTVVILCKYLQLSLHSIHLGNLWDKTENTKIWLIFEDVSGMQRVIAFRYMENIRLKKAASVTEESIERGN